ncbi:trans-acting enoyl reductase family protein [uncultured Microbulbifer sp.]|uniref:saccharopine dehydrogenase family protein n=1 Tax=uncultured Microbulbifer sp. TaxID=348147 RepID=UPI002632D876|nr:saccharopine dehydrogenase NADP-binding domain-containing protein [uncultured Microbulbifer sp.]
MSSKQKPKIFIYGATGYTGQLVAELAAKQAANAVLGGRDEEKLSELGNRLNLPSRCLSLQDSATLLDAVREFDVVLNLAGPYRHTAAPMRAACIATRVHYVDITGELEVFEDHAQFHDRARLAGITLLSGAGFDVVPSDCLAAHVSSRVENAEKLEMYFSGGVGMSRGTMRSGLGMIGGGVPIRENGRLIRRLVSEGRSRDCGDGEQRFCAGPWGDLVTAWHSTRIPNIQVFFPTKKEPASRAVLFAKAFLLNRKFVQWLLRGFIRLLPNGPEAEARDTARQYLLAEVTNARGETYSARLETPEAYTLTAYTALAVAEAVVDPSVPRGYQTPATALGANFILQFPGVSREDAAPSRPGIKAGVSAGETSIA